MLPKINDESVIMNKFQVEFLLDHVSVDLETCTNSLVWLMSNKTVNKTVYSVLSDITKDKYIAFQQGKVELNPCQRSKRFSFR